MTPCVLLSRSEMHCTCACYSTAAYYRHNLVVQPITVSSWHSTASPVSSQRFRVEFSNREVELENERAAFKSVLDATLAKVNPGLRILKKVPYFTASVYPWCKMNPAQYASC